MDIAIETGARTVVSIIYILKRLYYRLSTTEKQNRMS